MEHYNVVLTDALNPVGRVVKSDLEAHGLSVYVYPKSMRDGNHTVKARALANDCGAVLMPVFYPELLDDSSAIRQLDDKVSACDLATSLGIPQPQFYTDASSVKSFPCVFKRASGHGGDSVYFPKDKSTLEHLLRTSRPGTYLIQEHMGLGGEVCVECIRYGNSFYASAYKVLLPHAKGASVLRISIKAPELVSYCRSMLEALDYQGVCGFDFIRGKFLEANPRFCGGLRSSIASGLDLPWMVYQQMTTGHFDPPSLIRTGVITKSSSGARDYLRRRLSRHELSFRDLLLLLPAIKD